MHFLLESALAAICTTMAKLTSSTEVTLQPQTPERPLSLKIESIHKVGRVEYNMYISDLLMTSLILTNMTATKNVRVLHHRFPVVEAAF